MKRLLAWLVLAGMFIISNILLPLFNALLHIAYAFFFVSSVSVILKVIIAAFVIAPFIAILDLALFMPPMLSYSVPEMVTESKFGLRYFVFGGIEIIYSVYDAIMDFNSLYILTAIYGIVLIIMPLAKGSFIWHKRFF